MEVLSKNFCRNVLIFGGLTVLITFVFVLLQMTVFPNFVKYIAIIPRTGYGIIGIFLSCWGHWSWGHWANNMLGWVGLCPAMLTFGMWPFLFSLGFVQIFSGFFVWLIGNKGAHAGLSGVLCGYFGFFVVAIFLEQPLRIKTFFVVLVTAIVYFSSMFLTLFNFNEGVSWQGHMFGFLAGIIFSALFFTKLHDCLSDPLHWRKKKETVPKVFPPYGEPPVIHISPFEAAPSQSSIAYGMQDNRTNNKYNYDSNLVVYGRPCL